MKHLPIIERTTRQTIVMTADYFSIKKKKNSFPLHNKASQTDWNEENTVYLEINWAGNRSLSECYGKFIGRQHKPTEEISLWNSLYVVSNNI